MTSGSAPAPALGESARHAHGAFRAVMEATSRPGLPVSVPLGILPPAPLDVASAAILLALADFETSVWLDSSAASGQDIGQFLRFQAGCKFVDDPVEADFAVICDSVQMPPLAAFAQGTLEYPDRSTTLIIQVQRLQTDGWLLRGPGIPKERRFAAAPLPADMVAQIQANRTRFPRGIDLLFVAGNEIAAIPRSTHVSENA